MNKKLKIFLIIVVPLIIIFVMYQILVNIFNMPNETYEDRSRIFTKIKFILAIVALIIGTIALKHYKK